MKHQTTRVLSLLMAVIMAFSCAEVAFAADVDDAMTGEEIIDDEEETEVEEEPISDVDEEALVVEKVTDDEVDVEEVLPEEDVQILKSNEVTEENGSDEECVDAEDYGIATFATTASTSSSSPTTLSVDGTTKSYSIKSSGSWFKFTISSDGEVKLKLNSVNGDQVQYVIYSQDDTSTILVSGKCAGVWTDNTSITDTVSLSKGTYLLRLTGATNTVELSAKFISYGVGSTKLNSVDNPISYTIGNKVSGAVTKSNPKIRYKVTVNKKGTYKFTLTGGSSLPTVYLYNKSTGKQYQLGFDYDREYELSSGAYYMDFWGACGKYSVTMKLKLSKPTISKASNNSKGIKLTWKKSTGGATGYYVYRKKGSGSYKKIATVKGASKVTYTDTSVKSNYGTTYTYKVTAYYGSSKSTAATKKTVRLKTPTLSSVKSSKSKQATVKWKKVGKGTGYQVQYSTKKSFNSKKTVTVKGKTKTSKKLTGLTKGKTYYVRVRTYKTVSGKKYYSGWSSAKKVKVK